MPILTGNSNSVILTTESIFLLNNLKPFFMSETLRSGHVGSKSVIVSNWFLRLSLLRILKISSITFTLSPENFLGRFSAVIWE